VAALDPARNVSRVPAMLTVADCSVTALCPADTSLAHSWLIEKCVVMPRDADRAVEALRALVSAERFDFIVIADEALLIALARRLEPWMRGVLPFAADPATAALVLDKNRMLEAMDAAGIPMPPFVTVAARAGLEEAAFRIGFPLVLKDSVGCGGVGVRRASTAQELLPAFDSLAPAGEYTVQRFLTDRPGCTDVLFDHGTPRCWTSAYMLEQWPTPFEPATVRQPVTVPGVAAMLRAVGDATGFHGLGGVDWIEGEDGTLFFLEFNARVTHVVGPARPAFGREIGAMLAGEPAQPHEVVLPSRPIPVFPAHFVRALKTNRAVLLQWLPLRASSADLDWRDGGVLGTELRDIVAGALRRVKTRTTPD
jgi:predicted ATP-grasp superfamily ATP-dependent carboligase